MHAYLTCLVAVTTWGTQASPSLLANGGFERPGGWSLGPGTTIAEAAGRRGSRAVRVSANGSATAEQTVYGVTSGQMVTASAWVRTADVTPAPPAGFAFAAVYQYDAAGRIVQHYDFAQVTGTTEWERRTHTAIVQPGTETVVIRLGLHNAAGDAWFDDVNLAAGDAAADWTEPPNGRFQVPKYRAVILADPTLPVKGCATPAGSIRAALSAVGVQSRLVMSSQLAEPATLAMDGPGLLVVPTGATFPVEARKTLLGFLRRGGDLLCTGGYAFDHLVVRRGRRWVPYSSVLADEKARARSFAKAGVVDGGMERGAPSWTPEPSGVCTLDSSVAFEGTTSGMVTAADVAGGGRWSRDLDVMPGRTYLIGAHMRTAGVHGSGFAFLAVYQYDSAGKLVTFRDFAHATGTRGWTREEGRIVIHPSTSRVRFHGGLYLAAGTMWFDAVTCAPVAVEERINAHYGEPGDALQLSPMQTSIYSPDQPLVGARLVPSPASGLPGSWRQDVRVAGFEATAQMRANARWIPLVESRDPYGRPSGAAGALVVNTSGPFAGSRWALFGVTNRDVFAGKSGAALLRSVARKLAQDTTIDAVESNYAFYKPGETASISVSLACRTGVADDLSVGISLATTDGRLVHKMTHTVGRICGGQRIVTSAWRVPVGAPDFVVVRAVLRRKGSPIDAAETGFCVDSPAITSRAPRVTFRDNTFEVGGSPVPCMFGTDTYGNMLWSRTCSPLTWFRDLEMMRSYGLHVFENLQYSPPGLRFTEQQWRQIDALVQIAQRFHLPYMAGLLIGQDVVVDDATLARQASFCADFASRYHHVPGMIYYLNGDFRLDLRDTPDIRRLWNAFLQERYPSLSALQRAWGTGAPTQPFGDIPVTDYAAASGDDAHARDLTQFKGLLVRRWVSALVSAIRRVDREHPITSEYYQRPLNGIDLRTTIGDMDAANFGYFGPARTDMAELLATIKWNDMRRSGKSVNIGEFGVKTHDAWAQDRDSAGYHEGRTVREQNRLFWTIPHAALAYGVTKIQNWCWSDDPDNVFPWGMAWTNPLRAKPALKLYRNLRLLADRAAPHRDLNQTVLVVPDTWRFGVPEASAWSGLMNALECLLTTGVQFDVVNEADTGRLAESKPMLVIVPLAIVLSTSAERALIDLAAEGTTVYVSGRSSLGGVTPSGDGSRRLRTASVGRGRLIVCLSPWEQLPGHDIFVREPSAAQDRAVNAYFEVIDAAGVRPDAAVTSTMGTWRAAARRSGRGWFAAAFPRGALSGDRCTVEVAGTEITWHTRTDWPCSALLDGRQRITAATGGGSLVVAGRSVATGSDAWMLCTLDEQPVTESRTLAGCIASSGSVAWTSTARGLSAWIVEWRGDRAVAVAPLPCTRSRTGWVVRAPAGELFIACRRADRDRMIARMRWQP